MRFTRRLTLLLSLLGMMLVVMSRVLAIGLQVPTTQFEDKRGNISQTNIDDVAKMSGRFGSSLLAKTTTPTPLPRGSSQLITELLTNIRAS